MAPVIKAFLTSDAVETKLLVTAQHRAMLDQVISLFDLVPDYDLDLMCKNQGLFQTTTGVLNGVQAVFEEYKPDLVLVHGDTTTAMATALAAFYSRILVGHVEAGLRTGNLKSPWPEEMNRCFVGMISNLHFAPTQIAKNNLLKEGVDSRSVFVTGNTVVDALFMITSTLLSDQNLSKNFDKYYGLRKDKKLILITGHRRESFGRGFDEICKAIEGIAERDDVQIIYPVHPNPNVQNSVNKALNGKKNIFLIKPLEYLAFVHLMRRSYLILTDSGGIQEEAPSLGKPVLVMRDTTERPEAIASGSVRLVGTNAESIFQSVTSLLDDPQDYEAMASSVNPYGDGHAAERIRDVAIKYLAESKRDQKL